MRLIPNDPVVDDRVETMHVEDRIVIHTSTLFDPRTKTWLRDRTIEISVSTGLITSVYRRTSSVVVPTRGNEIDLRDKFVLPGMVDAHTHVFLHDYAETPAIVQMRDESLVERVVRGTNHCRDALTAGYTTYRDLGTEGLGEADVGLRDAVNRGLIPGPRLLVATEALASSGSYVARGENGMGGTRIDRISDPCDGIDGVRAAVRRRIGAGADVIKFYADYRRRVQRFPTAIQPSVGARPRDVEFPPTVGERSPNLPNYSQEEMDAIVDEARRARCPVAAHAQDDEAVRMAARAGVTTIEHGPFLSEETLSIMRTNDVMWVPTLAVLESHLDRPRMDRIRRNVKRAWELGIRIGAGGDTGAFRHGDNARELELLSSCGIPIEDVLWSVTLGGWEACGGERSSYRFGSVEPGWTADVIALETDPREGPNAFRKVGFVMKDGRVWKTAGEVVGMRRWL